MLTSNLTDELIRALQVAQATAREYRHATFSPSHLLVGLLHNDVGIGSTLVAWGTDIQFIRDWAEYKIEKYPKSARAVDEPAGDEKVMKTMEVADVIRLKLGEQEVSPFAVLIALTRPEVAFNKNELKAFPLTESFLLTKTLEDVQSMDSGNDAGLLPTGSAQAATIAPPSNPQAKAIAKFCIDKIAMAKAGKLDPIVGREKETRMMVETLGRRTKPNVIIVGEPGVGKTALVEGLTHLIINGNVPGHLLNSHLFQLDMGSLIAGASYKGEVEDRLKNIIAEIKQYERALLFIDEIHVLMDPQAGVPGLANLLKPELARGELTVIGATTLDEYRKYMERDEAFSRRFEIVKVDEPDDVRARRMIEKVVPQFEKHHGLNLDKDAVKEAVTLSRRYIKDRRLPDAALDLIDRTMAARKLMTETTPGEIEYLNKEFERLKGEYTEAEPALFLEELRWFEQQLHDRLSPVLLGQIEELNDIKSIEEPQTAIDTLTLLLEKVALQGQQHKELVDKTDIAAVVAYKTGIPLGKIQVNEQEKLMQLEDHLRKRVVGQDTAIEIISNAIRQSRSGVGETGKPASFFLLGPTGTGKTELAKAVSELLFNDEKALIRFDMSEYAEEHTVSLLKGSPPGYVGYEEGGLLVTRIRQQPFAVLLFDEVEKAHPKVYDIFLQILDEGRLHDTLDREGDFTNAILLFTSNIGSQFIVKEFNEGRVPSQTDLIQNMEGYFRPEFLGRLTGLTPFRPITEDTIRKIFNFQLRPLRKSLDKLGITLNITEEAEKTLALEGYNPQFGARPVRAVISNRLRQPLSQMIISGEIGKGSEVKLSLDQDNAHVWEH
ncbi:ATP-dependent Clp protease ATP-binding subunit [Dyadobacter sp. CY327]|uniref:ATP-dependent Clp protease ATP-binding subunit n=1 Tax=Dyadobacter sp. CY327 TaxID=2907301 RepID=UPI001F16B500|nr:ATP-dependent Clp protease ATP-binding subunit [Dyadobacter sp. CY327]MCE7070795.1 ATP-dependent Clp protease ATP-binding subunit [Dyadobacter sp. CY327]